jgi:hypothetical protein
MYSLSDYSTDIGNNLSGLVFLEVTCYLLSAFYTFA